MNGDKSDEGQKAPIAGSHDFTWAKDQTRIGVFRCTSCRSEECALAFAGLCQPPALGKRLRRLVVEPEGSLKATRNNSPQENLRGLHA
eukprot:5155615-Pleurochrysis_carterae.AAC.2